MRTIYGIKLPDVIDFNYQSLEKMILSLQETDLNGVAVEWILERNCGENLISWIFDYEGVYANDCHGIGALLADTIIEFERLPISCIRHEGSQYVGLLSNASYNEKKDIKKIFTFYTKKICNDKLAVQTWNI